MTKTQMTIEEIIAKQNGKSRSKPHDEEHHIQCACVNWFRYQYPEYSSLLFAVPNGGARSKATAGRLKAEGVVAGVADLLLLVPSCGYHGLCIEMKTKTGKQSDSQKPWQKEVQKKGYKYVVCRSLDEFIEIIDEYIEQ